MGRPRNPAGNYRLKINRSGYYSVYWTEGSNTKSASTGTKDREAAELFLEQFRAERQNRPPEQPIVSLILSGYYDDRRLAGAKSIDSTFRNCKNLGRHIGKLQPNQISQSIIRQYAITRLDEGVGNASVLRELAILRAALKWAAREQWIPYAPEFRMPVSQPKSRERWATREEIDRLLEAAEQTPHIRLYILIAISTGARKSAICGLKWDQVDFERGRIDFGQGTENKRRSIVPMTDGLKDELAYHRRVATTDYVLEFRGKPVGNVKKAFKRCADRAGLSDITPHILRHTAATWMVMSGIDKREAARFLGMSEEVFERIYGKHSPDYLKSASEALDVFMAMQRKPYLKISKTDGSD